MRVLLIKTSSMGDIIHTLPALTDAARAHPTIHFDWVVEEAFQEIPHWHPFVKKVIPINLRQWRKAIFARDTKMKWRQFREQIAAEQYDLVLDAQGLLKSAFLTLFTQGVRAGLDFKSARESFASVAYQRRYKVNFYQHAIVRMRQLFSQALAYPFPQHAPAFALNRTALQTATTENYLVFLHGTTWASKQWPEAYWTRLAQIAGQAGYRIKIGGGNAEEVARAERMAAQCPQIDVLPYLSIGNMAKLLVNAKAAVAVDTGFGHLAAALNVPLVSLYSSTNPIYTGALGDASIHLSTDFPCTPCLKRECHYRPVAAVTPACYTTLPPELVWEKVQTFLT